MKRSKGFSLIELLIVVAIILVTAGIAIPNLLRSRISAQESAAAATVRNLHNAQATYIAEFGSIGYANALQKLGPGTTCDQNTACLTDEILGCAAEPCRKSGYQYFLASPDPAAPFHSYTITATPVAWASTGTQNYCGVEDGVTRHQLNPAGKLSAGLAHNVCADSTQYAAISN